MPDVVDKKLRRKSIRQDALNIPNLLTMARIVMIPVCLAFLGEDTPRAGFWAALVFTLAALTDLVDGWLARKMNVVSVLGKLLDPLADKLIVMACLVWMVPMGRIPAWVVVLLLGRDIAVTGLRSVPSRPMDAIFSSSAASILLSSSVVHSLIRAPLLPEGTTLLSSIEAS